MLELRNIEKIYTDSKRRVEALKNINLSFQDKGFVLICGESGSGKTTLLNVIAGITSPTKGNIVYRNKSLESRKEIRKYCIQQIGYIFQDYNLLEDLTVKDNFLILNSIKNLNKTEEDIKSILKQVHLDDVINVFPSQLSGGQRQRVAVARALFMESGIILADEVTGALDEKNAREILTLLKEISASRLVIVVSHHKQLTQPFADRIIELKDGVIINDQNQRKESITEEYIEENDVQRMTKGLDFKYALKLGLKYFRFKTFKLFLSTLILILSFVLLLVVVGVMFFDENKAYDSGINNEQIGYLFIDKYEKSNYTLTKKYFTSEEITTIENNFLYSTPILFGNYLNYSIATTLNDQTFICEGILSLSEKKLEVYGFHLIGSLPKENEVVITREEANLLSISVENYESVLLRMNHVLFKISGILEMRADVSGNIKQADIPQNLLYVHETCYDQYKDESNVTRVLVESSDFSNICGVSEDLMKNDENFVYEFDNLVYNSIVRMTVFVESIFKIGLSLSILLIVFSTLLLIHFVYSSVVENKRDIQIIKMIGADNKDIFKLFIVQPFLITAVSFCIALGGYFIVNHFLNEYVQVEFMLYVPIVSLTLSKILIIIFTIIALVFFSALIPVLRIKKSK